MTLRLTPDAQLADLLRTMFVPADLLSLLLRYDSLAPLVQQLPSHPSPHDVVLAALRIGCIGDLLLAVGRERPARAAELGPVARRWGLDFPQIGLFILHTEPDAGLAGRLAEALGERGFAAELLAGVAPPATDSGYLLVGLTDSALTAPWITIEWLAPVASRGMLILPTRLRPCDPPPFMKVLPGFDLHELQAHPLDELCRFLVRDRRPATIIRDARVFRASESTAAAVLSLSPIQLRSLVREGIPPAALQRFLEHARMPTLDARGDLVRAFVDAPGVSKHGDLVRAFVDALCVPEHGDKLNHFAEWCVSAPQCRRSVRELLRRWGALAD